MAERIMGIDPGLSGALALISDGYCETWTMPIIGAKKKELDLPDLLHIIETSAPTAAIVEKVHAMPKQGVASTFKFGVGYGQIQGILAALSIPFMLVTPQQWKKVVLVGEDWKGDKSTSIKYCKRRFPDVSLKATERCRKDHDGIADAICLAVYGQGGQG